MSRRLRTALRWTVRIAAGAAAVVVLGAAGVYGYTERRLHGRYAAPEHALPVSSDAATVARGERLASVRGCVDCHGKTLTGGTVIDDPAIGRIVAPNLTRGGRGAQLTDGDWERAVRHGLRRDDSPLIVMPSQEFTGLTDEDLGAIVAYARSVPADTLTRPRSHVGPLARALFAAGVFKLPADQIDHARAHPRQLEATRSASYGAYLAATCTGCHGPGFSGGPIPGAPPSIAPAANITRAGIGHWTEADFIAALRTGRRPDGSAIGKGMPWPVLGRMTDVELLALYDYLRSVPPKPWGNR